MKRFHFTLTILFLACTLTSAFAENRQSEDKSGVAPAATTNAPAFIPLDLSWISLNGGGASYGAGGTRQIGYSVGQSVAGEGSGGTRKVGIGFWFGSTRVCGALKGDLNGAGGLSGTDVVLMLNCVFSGNGAGTVGGDCNLCYTDMNCLGGLTATDVVLELNYVFSGSPPPCI